MKKVIRPLVVANWKMNPQTASLATRLATDVQKGLRTVTTTDVVLAPPFLYIENVKKAIAGSKKCSVGAQNTHWEKLGPKTGETSISMLKSAGVSHVIIGHSERRAAGETDEEIAKKVDAALKVGIVPILCVGETKRDHAAHYLNVVENQVRVACKGIQKSKLAHLVIAYEPVWAISTGDGKGQTATPSDAYEMKLFIQKILSDLFGRNEAQKVRVLYGGSVNVKNCEDLMRNGMVDGFLVGGASLKADEFIYIVKASHSYETV